MKNFVVTKNERETMSIAKDIASKTERGTIILLVGDLGAGKTVFTKGFVSFFDDKTNVVSPTFTLINEYGNGIYHFDLYRIQTPNELVNIGADEILFDSRNICLVEWPSRVGIDYFGNNKKIIEIKKIDDNRREICIED